MMAKKVKFERFLEIFFFCTKIRPIMEVEKITHVHFRNSMKYFLSNVSTYKILRYGSIRRVEFKKFGTELIRVLLGAIL